MKTIEKPWSLPVAVEAIPEAGRHFAVEAPEAVREAIARLAALRALPHLSAAFDLMPQGAGVHVSGQVNARVGQTCGVTLEPIENEISEAVDLLFAPGGRAKAKAGGKAAQSADAGPEPLVDGVVDLGALATEFLLLGIDPYPRKRGVEFAPPENEDSGAHPFAQLEVLKKHSGRGKS